MRLTLIIISLLGAGGAERVMSVMANYWAKKGWDITLITFDRVDTPPYFPLNSAIKHHPLEIIQNSPNIIQGIFINLKRIRKLRKALKQSAPEAIISFGERPNILVLLSTFSWKIPKIISDRSIPNSFFTTNKKVNLLRRLIYPIASFVVVQTQAVAPFYFKLSKYFRARLRIIPNPALFPSEVNSTIIKKIEPSQNIVMALGRLRVEKGFDLLLRAFAKIENKYPNWSLVIWGEGNDRVSLENLRDQLGLGNRVQFLGLAKQPYKELKKADLFILSSRFEGFPNVLCEALACGLPVISFDCPNGPREIIRDGVDGVLVPPEDIEALALNMDQLMGNENKRKRLAERAPEVMERFGIEKVMQMWEDLINLEGK